MSSDNIKLTEQHQCPLGKADCDVVSKCQLWSQAISRIALPVSQFQILRCNECGIGVTHPCVEHTSIPNLYSGRNTNDFQPNDTSLAMYLKSIAAKYAVRSALKGGDSKQKTNSVLDIGCGNGSFALSIATCFSNTKVYASDFDPRPPMLLLNSNVTYLSNDHLETLKGKLDFIFCRHVLEHIDEPHAYLTRLRTLLSSNGVIFIEVPNLTHALRFLFGKYSVSYYAPFHFYHYTDTALRGTLEAAGFKILRLQQAEIPTMGRNLQIVLRWNFYAPLFILGVLLHPIQWLLGTFPGERTVLRVWAQNQ